MIWREAWSTIKKKQASRILLSGVINHRTFSSKRHCLLWELSFIQHRIKIKTVQWRHWIQTSVDNNTADERNRMNGLVASGYTRYAWAMEGAIWTQVISCFTKKVHTDNKIQCVVVHYKGWIQENIAVAYIHKAWCVKGYVVKVFGVCIRKLTCPCKSCLRG